MFAMAALPNPNYAIGKFARADRANVVSPPMAEVSADTFAKITDRCLDSTEIAVRKHRETAWGWLGKGSGPS